MDDRLEIWGRRLYAPGILALGLLALVSRAPVPVIQPWTGPLALPLVVLNAAVLVSCGLALMVPRLWRTGGLVLCGWLLAGVVLLHVRKVAVAPSDLTLWAMMLNATILAAAALSLGGVASVPGRWVAGLSLVVFGGIHLAYRQALGGMVPAWIPVHEQWPWLTGLAQIAAGLALLSGIRARLAALLTGLMYLSWVVLLHIPHTWADRGNVMEWAGLILAVTLSGAIWAIGSRVPERP